MMKKLDVGTVPHKPGCYLYKDKNANVVYVGKAKDLNKRVGSYFAGKKDEKTAAMLREAEDIEVVVTDSEVEALILENNLIKKHEPRFNILLKDSKRYAYLRLTGERFPRLVLARTRNEGGRYFGPFVSAATRDYVLSSVVRVFRLRTCKKMPRKECLRYHIGLCDAPCTGKIDEKDYSEKLRKVEMVLKGADKELAVELKTEMEKASGQQEYERALDLRNQMQAVEWLGEKQKMERQKTYDEDVLNYVVKDGHVYLILFNVKKGILENKQEFEFLEGDRWLEQFIVGYYSEEEVPKELILPRVLGEDVIGFLTEKRKGKVKVVVPKIGEKKQLLELVKKNIEIAFFAGEEAVVDLQRSLKLQEKPLVIECFDISHLSGTSTVASMVQFRNGKADKSQYRRYKIRTVEGVDDFRSIAEVVGRRYSRLLREKAVMPDLIVIDGGKGQLMFALEELSKLGVKVPMISLAKRFEEVYVPGLRVPLNLDKRSEGLKLLQRVRDEAHRFAISYNRLLRSKKVKDEI